MENVGISKSCISIRIDEAVWEIFKAEVDFRQSGEASDLRIMLTCNLF